MTGPLTRLRDRPPHEEDRRAALTAVIAGLVAVALLFALTRPAARQLHANTRTSVNQQQPAGITRADSRKALNATRAFLHGYLAYTYRDARAASIRDATRPLIKALQAAPRRASAAMRARHPRVLALTATVAASGQINVTATVADGGIVHYTLGVLLTSNHGHLLVSGLEGQ